jgi:hypothetical protein
MYDSEQALLQHLQQFKTGGIMVCVYHLHQPMELNFDQEAKDICLDTLTGTQQQGAVREQHRQQQEESSRVSLRRYLEVMFLEPKCAITLQVG